METVNKNSQYESTNCLVQLTAHDLRNSISSIISFADLMLHNLENGEIKDCEYNLQIIKRQAEHADNQLNRLIKLGKDLKQDLSNKETIDINYLFAYLIDKQKEQSKNKQIDIIQNQVDLKQITSNKAGIEIILSNLITNAIKFTNFGGKIELIALEKRNLIELIVKDNGIGIRKSQLEKIFDLQVSTLGTANEKGFGIGLNLCKQIAEQLNYNLILESEYEQGTTAKLIIPLN